MPGLLFTQLAPLVAAAPRPQNAFQTNGMGLRWEDGNGLVWDLAKGKNGVFHLAGTRGLDRPPGERYRDQSGTAHGSQHRGFRWNEREVFWPVNVWHPGRGPAFIERDRAWFAGMDPDLSGRWYATQPDGGPERYLELRYDPEKSGDEGFDTLPSITGSQNYGIYLTADQPFWVGDPAVKSFLPPRQSGPFFDPNGPQLFNIGQGSTTANASIDNLGDVASYGQWFVDGDVLAGAWVGVDGRKITIPFDVPVGRCLLIDSDPTRLGSVLYRISDEQMALQPKDRKRPSDRVLGVDLVDPVNKARQLGEADIAAVRPGKKVPLSIKFEGVAGVVEFSVPSLYKRAW